MVAANNVITLNNQIERELEPVLDHFHFMLDELEALSSEIVTYELDNPYYISTYTCITNEIWTLSSIKDNIKYFIKYYPHVKRLYSILERIILIERYKIKEENINIEELKRHGSLEDPILKRNKNVEYHMIEPILDSFNNMIIYLKENPFSDCYFGVLDDSYNIFNNIDYYYTYDCSDKLNRTTWDIDQIKGNIESLKYHYSYIESDILYKRLNSLLSTIDIVEEYRENYKKLPSFDGIKYSDYNGIDDKYDIQGIKEFNIWLLSISPPKKYQDEIDKEIYKPLTRQDYLIKEEKKESFYSKICNILTKDIRCDL